MNIQKEHIHLIVMVPPKVSISNLLGTVKGRTAIRVFQKFPYLKQKPYWGNHFWSPGYCVDTIGLDAEMIRAYVKHQEKKERRAEQLRLHLQIKDLQEQRGWPPLGASFSAPLWGHKAKTGPLGLAVYFACMKRSVGPSVNQRGIYD